MDPNSYSEVGKSAPSAFYGALSGSVCFPMPLMYNPMNSYPFMSTPFLPVHHPMLSQHGVSLQDSNHLLSPPGDLVSGGGESLNKNEDLSTRALALFQTRYQGMSKCFLPTGNSRKQMSMTKYCLTPPSLIDVPGTTTPSPLFGKDKGSSRFLQSGHESDGSAGLNTISPVSGTYTEKDCYLSSPATELEEADSSGKCTTEVVEQKVIPRWNCDLSETPSCPICGRTIALADLSEHYQLELHRLSDLIKKKEWLLQEEHQNDQATGVSLGLDGVRLNPYHDVEKRCPEFRKETYLRVRANRLSRLGVCNSRPKKQCIEEAKRAWKIHRTKQLCSPKLENCSEDVGGGENMSSSPAHQSMLMLELTVQQLAQRAEQRNDISMNNCLPENRNSSPFQGQAPPNPEACHDGAEKQIENQILADSSCNGFRTSPEMGSFQSSRYTLELLRRCNSLDEEKTGSPVEVKCLICMEQYKIPVVSVCCWHVHCETCWLKSLGSKRVCPQCDTITSPTDLRRIHL